MSERRFSDEIEALLSGHVAGVLNAEERERLMELALADQAVFDAMLEDEALRAAVAGGKERLLERLREDEDEEFEEERLMPMQMARAAAPAPMSAPKLTEAPLTRPRWQMVVAVLVLVGFVGWPTWLALRPEPKVEMAVSLPAPVREVAPVAEPAPSQTTGEAAPVKKVAVAEAPSPLEPQPVAKKELVLSDKAEAPRQLESQNVAPPAAAPASPAPPPAPSRVEAVEERKVAERVALPATAAADSLQRSFRAANNGPAVGGAMSVAKAAPPVLRVRVMGRELEVNAVRAGRMYVFLLVRGKVVVLSREDVGAGVKRVALPVGVEKGEALVLVAERDEELEKLQGGEAALPVRPWVRAPF